MYTKNNTLFFFSSPKEEIFNLATSFTYSKTMVGECFKLIIFICRGELSPSFPICPYVIGSLSSLIFTQASRCCFEQGFGG